MAYSQQMASPQSPYRDGHTATAPALQRRHASKQRFVVDLSQCLFDFVIQLLPTVEEMAVKEDVRKLLERLIRTIEPESRLLSFGSTANGFSLRNSDMDLCCLIDSDERLAASDLVTMLGDLLERETKFHVKPLPHARIPIVKLSLDPSPGLPQGIACDIGFENRLALENTRLLMCYAMIDPTRVRTMVLFLKVWSKRRKINSPYKGTLSSYGYVLLVIYFLVHVKNPPVLPNLQQMPPLRPISKEDTHVAGFNTWFFDDIELLRQRWHSENNETVAELLIDFFRYYSRDFLYNTGVASIRAGLLKKDSKGWQNDLSGGRYNDARERNRLCIEDPFETDYNVSRCVTKDGLYTIRGEFMRASRILSTRPERAIIALAELCEERKEEDLVTAPPPRLSNLPPQTPYTVGSQSMRPKGAPAATEGFSPPTTFEPGPRLAVQQVTIRPPPEHMAPKRSKWTSPPPPEAPPADHSSFETQLGKSLELATSSTEAREREKEAAYSSEGGSEVFTDDNRSDAAESDDIASVRSFTEGSTFNGSGSLRRPSWHNHDTAIRIPQANLSPVSSASHARFVPNGRGRFPRAVEKVESSPPVPLRHGPPEPSPSSSPRSEVARRSISGPPRSLKNPMWHSAGTPLALATPLPPSPESPQHEASTTVYYQTTTRSPRPTVLYPSPGSHSSFLSQYQSHQPYHINHQVPHDIFPSNLPPALTSMNPRGAGGPGCTGRSSAGPETPTPTSYASHSSRHSHSHSTTTITAPTPPPHATKFPQPVLNSSPLINGLRSHSRSRSTSPTGHFIPTQRFLTQNGAGTTSPQPSASTSNGSSPTPSSTGYSTSISRSPSPHSPSPPPTAMPLKQKDDNLVFPTSFSSLTIQDGASDDITTISTRGLVVGLEPRRDNGES
ncbi:hypothetical protein BDQ12DRAFT_686474 [Crucibulum laeve]|uniref:polynucleotide adenylyltransferase n=1 Tax=Crucibulum laeve TaxID=68775 RepID=A0A5C3LUK4_9AGAR|nr:hypothetical protein BDQ12DRAFT_686474 [Crucibulum laeve]